MHKITCAVLTVGGWYDAEDLAGRSGRFTPSAKKTPAP